MKNYASIIDGPMCNVCPLQINGCTCITYYTKNYKIRLIQFIRCEPVNVYLNMATINVTKLMSQVKNKITLIIIIYFR